MLKNIFLFIIEVNDSLVDTTMFNEKEIKDELRDENEIKDENRNSRMRELFEEVLRLLTQLCERRDTALKTQHVKSRLPPSWSNQEFDRCCI